MTQFLLQDYTFKFKDTGLVINTDSMAMPFIDVHKVAGLDMPDFRINERTREGMDGGSLDIDFAQMRTIVIDGTVYHEANNMQVYLESLKVNFAPSNVSYPFYFYAPGLGQRMVMCKSLGVKYDWDLALRTGRSPIQFQLKAEDPTIYIGEPVTYSTALSSIATTGRGFNKGYPYGYGASVVVGNGVNARNEGGKPVGALIRFYNVISPSVTSDTTGDVIALNVTVGAGEFYQLDLRNRTVTINGETNRRNLMANRSRWFLLQPGDNMLRFTGAAGVGTPLMTVTYMSGSY